MATTRRPLLNRRPKAAESATGSARPAGRTRDDERRSRLARIARLTRAIAISILILLVALIAGFQWAERDQVRAGVHAFGVDLGGMTRDEARAALTAAAGERTGEPLILTDGEARWTLRAEDLGLAMDVDGALDDAFALGRSGLGPSRLALLWHFKEEPEEVAAERVGVRADLLDAEIAAIAADIAQEKIDPQLTLSPAGVEYVNAQVGRQLDVAATRAAILGALASGQSPLPLVIDETQPAAYDVDYTTARTQLGRLWDAPIELVAAGETWTLTPDQISNWLSLVPARDGRSAKLEINEGWVDDVVWEISLATDRFPQSAHIWWDVGGNLIQTAEGAPGKDLDEGAARGLIHAAFLGETNANRVDLPVAITNPPALPGDLSTLGIRSLLAEASTAYGGGIPERMHNIELAAQRLNGVVILPGQTFSFNSEVGPTTVEAGFQIAYGIANEEGELRTVPSEAGGICQVATTVFQPVFWTGYPIEQRSTHSYWIPNYASNGYVGLDATVDEAVGADFKWTNTTGTAVMIEAAADGERFAVRLYGTPPPWRVEVDPPKVENLVAASEEVVYEESDTIPAGSTRQIERANDGFDVTVTRRVIQGDVVNTEEFKASYGPSRNVVLVGTGE
jgi:vancomycin resistance protein YoaR